MREHTLRSVDVGETMVDGSRDIVRGVLPAPAQL